MGFRMFFKQIYLRNVLSRQADRLQEIAIFWWLTEGSLEVKLNLPTIRTDKKQRWEESEKRREEKKKEDQKRESLRRKKIQVREKVGKSRNTVFFR